MLSQQLKESLHNYQAANENKILELLLQTKIQDDQSESFNQNLDVEIRKSFENIMIKEDFSSLCSLIKVLCATVKKLPIKNTVINLLDNVLQCVGITDLKKVLNVIIEQIGDSKFLSLMDAFKLLRMINTLLKRISKTQDFQIRGELQMALTKILSLCHDSGFHYKNPPAKTSEINTERSQFFENQNITMKFFEEFWQLQQYFFMDINTMCVGQNGEPNPRLLFSRLNRIKHIIEETIKYFKNNQIEQISTLQNFPLKFLKLPNLLALQLNDGYFRAVLMIQTLILCFSLKNTNNKPLMNLGVNQKEIVNNLEKWAEQQLSNLQMLLKVNDLKGFIDSFLKNQLVWIDTKDNWKERKNVLFKAPSYEIKQFKRKMFNPDAQPDPAPPQQPQPTAQINLQEKMARHKKQAKKRIGIDDSRMSSFLNHTEPPNLKTQPTLPSFSYYFSQAEACIDSFDEQNLSQRQFDSRRQYNLFQWKTLRSLYRESLKDFTMINDKNSLYKDYRLLNLLHKRQSNFYDEPRKRVKPNQQQPDQ